MQAIFWFVENWTKPLRILGVGKQMTHSILRSFEQFSRGQRFHIAGGCLNPQGISPTHLLLLRYCTSWCSWFPSIHRVLYIPGGAGFLPSTVAQTQRCFLSTRTLFLINSSPFVWHGESPKYTLFTNYTLNRHDLFFRERKKNSRVLLSLSKIGSHHTTTGSAPPVNVSPFTKTVKFYHRTIPTLRVCILTGNELYYIDVLHSQKICYIDLPPFFKPCLNRNYNPNPSPKKSLDATPFLIQTHHKMSCKIEDIESNGTQQANVHHQQNDSLTALDFLKGD